MVMGAATALPALLIQLPAGASVDRWNRLRVMTLCETFTGLVLITIPAALMLRHLTLLIAADALSSLAAAALLFVRADLRPARSAAPGPLWHETAQGLGWIWMIRQPRCVRSQ